MVSVERKLLRAICVLSLGAMFYTLLDAEQEQAMKTYLQVKTYLQGQGNDEWIAHADRADNSYRNSLFFGALGLVLFVVSFLVHERRRHPSAPQERVDPPVGAAPPAGEDGSTPA